VTRLTATSRACAFCNYWAHLSGDSW